jgi:hypothetical protein
MKYSCSGDDMFVVGRVMMVLESDCYVRFKLLLGFGRDWKWGHFGDYKYAGAAEFDVLTK